ncbi:MAG TPA: 2-oxoglutarate dehydrogenase complex dihydrolipoyllysine-residue succinyltransferase [Nitrosomonas sp.]|nr:2-oxoglutarate dehydrogenase complex dihydrolipoyllysine-residue succinyltransferase [Nitrosomonas sp.]HMW20965.1 2-oxoglutarate dehydrogenase complex dihydrolipoyllysine-residue succinyltransferase [Nitrosomonas sp.]HMW68904.1 2-oxoglutarate dehydrogenase complex dihydrolipoyllysine-residue succinyltransferase [Nitrosomonas sp.]HMY61263.1 2-oxoglutarate dehydrogenase complex dihydrolipoyllysine-residue succinyltransferase [Nitrosomonas sp.]HMY89946.1 2-oxoglutarate dehydrogenase complex dih
MLIEIKVPQLSESVAEATLISWHKKQGEKVVRGENLIDIETDKVVLELPATQDGILIEILKNDGATVKSGEIIAKIETEMTSTASVSSSLTINQGTVKPKPETKNQIAKILMPAAQKMAEENQLKQNEVNSIVGTGREGRVTKEDIANHIKSKPQTAEVTSTPASILSEVPNMEQLASNTERLEQRVPMTRLRMRIAERLVQSQSTAAILTTFNEVNMQAVIDLRTRYKDKFEKEHGVKLGFMSFFVKAVVAALKKFPIINASVDGNDIIYHPYYDIGIAVASPRGLVVPILRNADQLTQVEIEKQIADFVTRAQNGKLTIDELSGGTFSITNGGVFGSMLSTPIINPPQSAILGIHATKERPVVENGQIVIRPMNYLALSYDHRIIDGKEAVLSLVTIKEALEYPMSPLFES